MRPKIICHMVSSIDGRLLPGRWTPPAESLDDGFITRIYEETGARLGGDGFLVGRTTMEEFDGVTAREQQSGTKGPRPTHVARGDTDRVAVVVDPKGKLHYEQGNADGDPIVAILGEGVSDTYLAELRETGISYLFAGPDGHELALAMNTLGEAFGIETLLLEGGGTINGAFLKARLIDEISLLVYPGIDGLAGSPTIFDYLGQPEERPALGLAFRHTATEALEGGMVWLRYRVERSPASP